MRKQPKIIQKSISIETHDSDNHLVLVFMDKNRVAGTMVVPMPQWFRFYDENYNYYLPCLN